MLVSPGHAALEHTEKAFEGIGVNLPALTANPNIADLVVHKFMLFGGADLAVNLRAVGVQNAVGVDISPKNIAGGHLGCFLDALSGHGRRARQGS